MLIKQKKRYRRHKRIRTKISGIAQKPRLFVFKSAKHIYAQLIDDEKGKIITAANDKKINISHRKIRRKSKKEIKEVARVGKTFLAFEIGKLIAKKALEKKIEKVVFDRGGCKYHGRVKALAEGAREGGLKF
jgi:large subunit ribosomal protein L18